MKIPRTIQIGESLWTMKMVQKIPGENSNIAGLCDPSTKTIYICKGMDYLETLQTVIHELSHSVAWEYDFYDVPHKYINWFSEGFAKLWIDNF